jgi:hypothetical protein
LQAAKDQHIAPTQEQQNHQHLASENRDLRASVNNGRPTVAAVSRAGDFSPNSAVAAKSAGHVKPASFTTGSGLNGAHPAGKNLVGPGNAAAVKTHADPNLAVKSNGAVGATHHDATHHDASHGANKNAVANLNAGSVDKHQNLGSTAAHTNGAPTHANGAPAHTAAMMKMPGNPAAHAQPHPNMPKPAAHAQPHPAAPPKKDPRQHS